MLDIFKEYIPHQFLSNALAARIPVMNRVENCVGPDQLVSHKLADYQT